MVEEHMSIYDYLKTKVNNSTISLVTFSKSGLRVELVHRDYLDFFRDA